MPRRSRARAGAERGALYSSKGGEARVYKTGRAGLLIVGGFDVKRVAVKRRAVHDDDAVHRVNAKATLL